MHNTILICAGVCVYVVVGGCEYERVLSKDGKDKRSKSVSKLCVCVCVCVQVCGA